MNNELLDSMRAANREFQEFMEIARPNGGKGQEIEKAIRLLSRVHFRLKHISKCLAKHPKPSSESSDGASEVQQYRKNLTALKGVMEDLQSILLAENARIKNARSNVRAARAWADSVRAFT